MKIALRTKIFYVLVCASLMVALALGAQPLTSAKAAGPEACYSATTTTMNLWPVAYTYGTAGQVYRATVAPVAATGTVTFIADPDGTGPAGGIVIAGPVPVEPGTGFANLTTTDGRELDAGVYGNAAGGIYAQYSGDSVYCASAGWNGALLTVNQATLTVGGTPIVNPASRVYDRTPNVTFTGGTLVGVIAGDVVTLATQVGSTNPPDAFGRAGVNKPVTPAFTLGGADAGNYTLTQPTCAGCTNTPLFDVTITPKPLTVTGITASDKVYDATAAATINTTGAVFAAGGVILGDAVNLVGVGLTGTFTTGAPACVADKNVGTGKTVCIAGYSLGGADAANYSLNTVTTTASITPKPLTLNPVGGNVTVNAKPYDENNNVLGYTYGGPDPLVGVIGGDVVAFCHDGINFGTFASANAGTWAVTAAGWGGCGADAGNYTYPQPTGLTGTINKATANLALFNPGPHTYNATPWVADLRATNPVSGNPVAGVFAGVTYNGSATPPTNVGVYAVTITSFTPTDTANYNTNVPVFPATTIAMGNLTIQKATPAISITNSPTPWNGAAQPVVLQANNPFPPNLVVGGVFGNVRYNGDATIPSNVGTYQITASFTPTDTANYNSLGEAFRGNFVIAKADPILSVTNSPVTYNGAGQAATVSANVAGVVSGILTGGAATQTNAGAYAVTANFAPTDTVHYNSLTAAAAGNFVINKATPTATLAVTNSPVPYDGDPHAATVGITSSSVPGAVANILTGGALTQTLEGTYAVTADFFPTDAANYNTLAGLSAGDFVIAHVEADLITNGGFNQYDAGTKIPTNWSPVKFGATDGKATARKEGLFSVRLLGVAGQRKTLSQEILNSGSAGDTFTFKVWIKGSSIPAGGVCRVQIFLYDGSVLKSVRAVQCPTGTFNWTQKTLVFTSAQAYNRIKVQITYFKDSGYVWFDAANLKK